MQLIRSNPGLVLVLALLADLPGPVQAGPDGGVRCPKVPKVNGEVFRYGQSLSVPQVRWEVETELLAGLDLDGAGSPRSTGCPGLRRSTR